MSFFPFSALEEKSDDLELKKQIAYTQNGLGLIKMNSGEYDEVCFLYICRIKSNQVHVFCEFSTVSLNLSLF